MSVDSASILHEARSIYRSSEFASLREAAKAGRELKVHAGCWYVQFEPQIPYGISAMTDFQGRGFTMGRKAFSSEEELRKTVLQEVYRLLTSQVGQGGAADRETAASETAAAFQFAEQNHAMLA